jgi:CheY-like chemotaxis protein
MVRMSRALTLTTPHPFLTAIKFDMTSSLAHHGLGEEGRFGMHVQIDEAIHSVLIVEDEMIVAMLMEDLVRELGVRDIHICSDSASALEIVRTMCIDCAILDLRLRDGTSMGVADALADRDIPFLFSTGSDVDALEPRHAGRPMISKPFMDDDFRLILLDTWSLVRTGRSVGSQDGLRVAPFGASD